MALEVGSRLGHYDVTALIDEGGMRQVYRATDTNDGSLMAANERSREMRKGIRYVAGLGAGLCLGLMAGNAGAQGLVGPSLADAKKGLAAAEGAAVEMGVGLTCAVVDARGALVALARMDDARYFTADVAVGKARATAAFGAPSGALTNVGSLGLDTIIEGGGMLFLQGAVPITKNGQPVGALGCSGASGQQDEDAAKAGVAAMQ